MSDEPQVEQSKEWATFHDQRAATNYPKWPNEAMVKILFGGYLSQPRKPQKDWKVLDVGCGFGNNLLPFAGVGCECHGIEIDQNIAKLTQVILDEQGCNATISEGANRTIPYPDETFDLLLSIGTVHYEGNEENMLEALQSFYRVLKPGGVLYMVTTGPEHEFFKRAKPLGNNRYLMQNYDFRDGQEFFFFEDEETLRGYCDRFFDTVEIGRVIEQLMSLPCDSLIAVCTKAE